MMAIVLMLAVLVSVLMAGMPRLPNIRQVGGSTVPSQVSPSSRFLDCNIREAAMTAADTWYAMTAFNAVTEGPINVPTDAKYIAGLEIAMAVEQAAAVSNKLSSMIRMSGNALREGGRYHFLGPVGTGVICSANGSNARYAHPVNYPLAIPVKGGNQLNLECMSPGDDPTDWFIGAKVLFSDQPAPGGFVDGDVREVDMAAVNTDYSLTNVGADALGHFRVPIEARNLAALAYAAPFDPGVTAAVLKLAAAFQLRGDALDYGGSFRFLGAWGGFDAAGTPVGGDLTLLPPQVARIDLPIKGGNTLEGHAMLLAEDPGDAQALMGVLYA